MLIVFMCFSYVAVYSQTTDTTTGLNSAMQEIEENLSPSLPWINDESLFDAIEAVEERPEYDHDYYYSYEDIYDEAIVSKRDNSNSSVPSLRTAAARCVKKNNRIDVKASPPSFRKPKGDMQQLAAAYLGHRVELFCPHRKGCPRGNITWTKDGEVLTRRGRKSGLSIIRMKQNGGLIIEDNRKEDDGNYTCIISNKFGTIHHSIIVQSVSRVVAMEPKIHPNQPGNHTVQVGDEVTLWCQLTVEDESSSHYVGWFKHYQIDGKWMDEEGAPFVNHLQDSQTFPEDDEKLVLSNVTLNDTGWYSCRVRNQYGKLVSSGYVEVVEESQEVIFANNSLYTYLSIGVGGVIGLSLTCVLLLVFVKYRKEREEKAMAIRTAQCVVKWTKKIIIERNMKENEDELLCPIVRMEKVMVQGQGSSTMSDHEVGDYYEFQLDADWEVPRELVVLGEELGQGAFGRVVRGTVHRCVVEPGPGHRGGSPLIVTADAAVDPIVVAVKMLQEEHSEEEIVDLVKEIEIMKAVGGHVNIVNLLGACTQPSGQPLLAIIEFAEYGNLRDHLRSRKGCRAQERQEDGVQSISLREMLSLAWQVARGMQFLASRKCVHRDLAARNVLVAKGGVAKIADFGLARDTRESDYYRKRGEGKLPVLWMSPESLFEGVSTTMSDVWSYGVLLWEIVTWGERPYPGVTTEAVLELVRDGYRMSRPGHCPHHLYGLMRNCWHSEPSLRHSWSSLIDALLVLYDETLPGIYLDLALPVIPTPPSSPESGSSIFSHSNLSTRTLHIEPPPPYNPGYMPGISPLVSVTCFPTPPSSFSPTAPQYSQVALSRRTSEESGYSSTVGNDNDGGGLGLSYYNV